MKQSAAGDMDTLIFEHKENTVESKEPPHFKARLCLTARWPWSLVLSFEMQIRW